jgi:CelD/BcsL family acetyltransferase involved in cellulose biosynthesis
VAAVAEAPAGIPSRIADPASHSDSAGLRPQWQELNQRVTGGAVFQGYEWHAGQAAALTAGERPLILTLPEGNGLEALAPLKVAHRRMFGRPVSVVEFLGFPRADYCDLLVAPGRQDAVERLLLPILQQEVPWDVLRLGNVPESSPHLAAVRQAFERAGYPMHDQPPAEAPACILTPEAAYAVTRKKSLKRHHNHFAREGELELRHLREAADIDPWLDRFFDQHVARRALTSSPSPFRANGERQAVRTMVAHVAPTGRLLFSVLLFRGCPLAFHLGFLDEGRLLWYVPAFDVAYIRHSPGEVLLKLLLEHAIAHGCREFDFGIGEEPYKYRFANHVRRVHGVEIFRTPALARARRLVSGAKAVVKKSDTLARIARQTIQAFR